MAKRRLALWAVQDAEGNDVNIFESEEEAYESICNMTYEDIGKDIEYYSNLRVVQAG